jgi:hypothetical protein
VRLTGDVSADVMSPHGARTARATSGTIRNAAPIEARSVTPAGAGPPD